MFTYVYVVMFMLTCYINLHLYARVCVRDSVRGDVANSIIGAVGLEDGGWSE